MADRLANFVLSGAAFLCVGLLAWLVAQHGWTAHYLFLVVLATILGGTRWLPSAIRSNAALVLCSVAFSCYLVEVVLVLLPTSEQRSIIGVPWLPQSFGEGESTLKMRASLARQQHVRFDTRNKLSVVMDLRNRGVDAWPQVPAAATYKDWPRNSSDPSIVIDGVSIMPLGGIANKVTVHCNENGAYTVYVTDEHGFNNPKGLWQLARVDIAVVGDSFVNGACVPSDKNFVALMRQRYPKIINVGRDGNGPLFELASIKEYLGLINPKVVFWCYYEGNDLREDLLLEKKNPLLLRYLSETFSQELSDKQVAIDQAWKSHIDTVQHSQSLLGHVQGIISNPPSLEVTLGNLERIAKLTSLRQAIDSVVY